MSQPGESDREVFSHSMNTIAQFQSAVVVLPPLFLEFFQPLPRFWRLVNFAGHFPPYSSQGFSSHFPGFGHPHCVDYLCVDDGQPPGD